MPDTSSRDDFDKGLDDCVNNVIYMINENDADIVSPGLIVKAVTKEDPFSDKIFAYFFPDLVPAYRDEDKAGDLSPKLPVILRMFKRQSDATESVLRQAWFIQETVDLDDADIRYTQHLWPTKMSKSMRRVVQIDGRDNNLNSNRAVLFLDTSSLQRLKVSSVKTTYSDGLELEDHVLDILFDD